MQPEKQIFRSIRSETDDVKSFFNIEKVPFEVGAKAQSHFEERSITYINRLREFIGYIITSRKLVESDNLLIKFGMDGGGGYVKLCMSIAPKEGLGAIELSSVQKIFILAIVTDIPETFANVSKILKMIDLTDPHAYGHSACFSNDLKLTNKLLGIQDYGCAFPCYVCEAKSSDFKSRKHTYAIRTIGSIRENNRKWIKSGGNLKDLCNFKSCIDVPVFTDVLDCATTIDVVVPPELHLLLGFTNYIVCTKLNSFHENVEKWTKQLGCIAGGRSGNYAGNACKKILENAQSLKEFLPPELDFYADILSIFNEVVHSCFGRHLHDNFEEKIESLEYILDKYCIDYTPKIHFIIEHLVDYLKNEGCGLGVFSEQALEAVHHKWKLFFENFCSKPGSSGFTYLFLSAVGTFNAKNI